MNDRLSLGAFAVVLAIAWFCYSASYGAQFQLDDRQNLSGLAQVTDQGSALDFVFSGEAGPTGRPLALLSFALQAEQWESGADAFLRMNIFIHLCNALLLAFAVRLLLAASGAGVRQARNVAYVAASTWVLLPLLATSTLLVVQRMTTLSALVMLLGIVVYLYLRSKMSGRPIWTLAGMTAVLGVSTVVASLSKESALLLPALVLVLESTVLRRPDSIVRQHWRVWKGLVLGLPLLAILFYLASRVPYAEYLVARRDFNALERLLTECQILWVYVSKAVVGLPGRLGIYHDDVTILRDALQPATLIAALSWCAALVTAVVWRRRFPWYAFAVLWFVVGHLIESTLMPLELYFEHRNYVPMMGPIIALSVFLLTHSATTQRVARFAVPLMLLMNAAFLYGFASLQANPAAAAQYWAVKHPNSVRAVTNLVTHQLAEQGVESGMRTLSEFLQRNPRFAYLYIQQLNAACMLDPNTKNEGAVEQIAAALHQVDFSYSAGQMLSELADTAMRTECASVTGAQLLVLADALANNPRYARDPRYQALNATLLASIKRNMGRTAEARQHLEDALGFFATPDRVMMATMTMVEAGDIAMAEDFLAQMSDAGPRNPLKAIGWKRNISDLQRYVGAVASQE